MGVIVVLVTLSILVFCLGHLVYVDLKRRIIPRRDCYLIAVSGSVLQLWVGGLATWLPGVGFGLLALGFCLGVKKIARLFRLRAITLGGGDVRLMVALSLATGPWAIWGAFGAAFAALLWAIGGMVTSRLHLADTFPLAPCLACWPLASLGMSLL